MTNPYRPRADSLAAQCIAFFRTIPDPGLLLSNAELANLAAACNQRLAKRLNPPQAAMPAAATVTVTVTAGDFHA